VSAIVLLDEVMIKISYRLPAYRRWWRGVVVNALFVINELLYAGPS